MKNTYGRCALYYAALYGLTPIIIQLLEYGANVNSEDTDGSTPLHKASFNGYYQPVSVLLDAGADINNKSYNNWTALHFSAMQCHYKVSLLLCDRGIDIANNIDEYSPNSNDNDSNTDCRPIIRLEVENRHKRDAFNSFITYHIEYKPYISRIYSICYPTTMTVKNRTTLPVIGWTMAEKVRNKYYFEEILFHVHMHVGNVYSKRTRKIQVSVTSVTSVTSSQPDKYSSITELASSNNDISNVMTCLADRLVMYLKPPN